MTEDDITARLLQVAGRRPDVPAARSARVHATVHDAWRATVRRRRVRRVAIVVPAVAAVAALLLIAVSHVRPANDDAMAIAVATLERAEGTVRTVSPGRVGAGEWITTGPSARAAFRTLSGTSVRVDRESRLRFVTDSIVELTAGAMYLDTAPDASPLEIRTPLGIATDIGTQFEVRLANEALRVRVRSGAVAVRRGRESIHVGASTELTVTSKGVESRTAPQFGSEWDWAASLAPVFQMSDQPLSAFLNHLARENGWVIRYEDAALARDASTIVLHGSVDGLDAREALSVALTTAALSYTLDRGQLLVFRQK